MSAGGPPAIRLARGWTAEVDPEGIVFAKGDARCEVPTEIIWWLNQIGRRGGILSYADVVRICGGVRKYQLARSAGMPTPFRLGDRLWWFRDEVRSWLARRF